MDRHESRKSIPVDRRNGDLWVGELNVTEAMFHARLPKHIARTLGLDGRYGLHVCRICQSHFIGGRAATVCSDACAMVRQHTHSDAVKAKRAAWRALHPKPPTIPRAELRARKRAKLVCQFCGTPLQAERASRRFCSATCRQRSHRHPEQRRQPWQRWPSPPRTADLT